MFTFDLLKAWDELETEAPKEDVRINGALNVHEFPISQYEVLLTYGDLTLIVAMIEDYVKGLDVVKAGDINWEVYYRKKFKQISDKIQNQIDYDYEKKLEKCLKKSKKDDDIGEDAMVLAIKKSMKEAEKKAAKEQEKAENKDNEK